MTAEIVVHPQTGTIDKIFRDIGSPCNGYKHVRIGTKWEYVHRLVWEHVHGPIPKGMHIDHINGDKSDNRIENLRLATPSQNAQNRKNTVGVSFCKRTKKWLAQIQHNKQQFHIGRFNDIRVAEMAYAGAAALLHSHNPKATKKAPNSANRSGPT